MAGAAVPEPSACKPTGQRRRQRRLGGDSDGDGDSDGWVAIAGIQLPLAAPGGAPHTLGGVDPRLLRDGSYSNPSNGLQSCRVIPTPPSIYSVRVVTGDIAICTKRRLDGPAALV